MKYLSWIFGVLHGLMALMFAFAAVALMVVAAQMAWTILQGGLDRGTALGIIEAVGILAGAVVAMQIAQTIFEEEVVRNADISAPTRVRRYLSRFFVVLMVALAIEGLVATFKAQQDEPAQLLYAAALLVALGIILAAWGVFIHLNSSAEVLEPEAMDEAKKEDKKLK